ncbi:MAG TPA: glycosyl hydrolase family 8 [Polyangiaceae bacterium]
MTVALLEMMGRPRVLALVALSGAFAFACSASSPTPNGAGGGAGDGAVAGVAGIAAASGSAGSSGSTSGGAAGSVGGNGSGGTSAGATGSAGVAGTGVSGGAGVAGASGLGGAGGVAGGVGGLAGASGSAGSAGASGGSGPHFGMGGPFTFPQSKKPAYCTLTTASGAAASAQAAYDFWKTTYLIGSGGVLRVQRPENGNDTVSEGIGYGMLAAVYLADKATFDGLWAFAKAHFDANGLMNWQISSAGTTAGAGSATDADEDMAWALIQASDQWSDASYFDAAKLLINAMKSKSIATDGMLRPGDGWGSASTTTYPDYFSPAYFRVFAQATGDMAWATTIIDRNYAILSDVTGKYGLVPDSSSSTSQFNGNYGYDATRTPWRMGMDYCFNGETRAKAYLDKLSAFFAAAGAVSTFGDGYDPSTGNKLSSNANMAFIGPAGVSGMDGQQTLLDNAFSYGAANNGGTVSYFAQSLRVITMLMMSGNLLDYTK